MKHAQSQWRRGSVLAIEDDASDQKIIREALKHADVRIVPDGDEAMEYLRREGRYAAPAQAPRPQLILLDLQLPGRDGKQVLEAARSLAELRYTPIVVVTSSMREQDVEDCYRLGCSSYVIKPFGVRAFADCLQEIHSYWCHIVTQPSSEPLRGPGGGSRGGLASAAVRGGPAHE